jgi:hypothetical protein
MRVLTLCALLATRVLASGYLTVETTPSGVEIWYARPGEARMQYLGDSPLEGRELRPGTYGLWLISGKDTLAVPGVSIAEGQHTRVSREMPADYGSLRVVTDPDSGEIRLDGVKLGNSPYSNSLVLPGNYRLQLVPRGAQHRSRSEKLAVRKGDTLDYRRPFSFRDKSFLEENLPVRPWALQLEWGWQFLSQSSSFDTSGKRKSLADSLARSQSDFPATLRLGFPYGLELHAQLPFHAYDDKDPGAPAPRDFLMGLKYAYRPLGAGIDASYSFGTDAADGGFNHNRLILTAVGVHARGKILLLGNAGFAFHFTDRDSSGFNPGDVLFANARIGYAAGPFLPYLGAKADFILDGNLNDSTGIPGGRVIALEPGVVFDIADLASLQLAVPFAVLGKNAAAYWALQASLALRFGFKD